MIICCFKLLTDKVKEAAPAVGESIGKKSDQLVSVFLCIRNVFTGRNVVMFELCYVVLSALYVKVCLMSNLV